MVISYSLLMIIVPPLLPLSQWETFWFAKVPLANSQQSGHNYSLFLLQNRWMGFLVMSIFKFFTFCWYPGSSIKVETTDSSWKHEFLVVTHADESCFTFVFLRRWCDSNVMLFNNKYIQKSLSSGWGEKTKLSREFLSNIFSMKTIERTLFTSYCLWLTHDLLHVSFLIVCSYPIKFFLFSNYPMNFNVLRHVMKFCNSAVLRLRSYLFFVLIIFVKTDILVLHCKCFKMLFLYTLQKLKKKKAAPSRVIELGKESEQSCSTGRYLFKTENLYSIS